MKLPWFIWMLIQIALMMLVVYALFFFLGMLGIPVPGHIQNIVLAICFLIAIGIIWMAILPRVKSGNWSD